MADIKAIWINWRSWFGKGFWAILDQSLFAGTNFLVNILLARWLSAADYGAFTVTYSVFLLLAAFHTAVLTEPMFVFGAGKYAEIFHKYLGFLLYGHTGLSAIISLCLAIAALLFWQFGLVTLAQALFGLVIAAPFILLLWLLRRAFYVRFQPQWAATGGGLYLLLMLIGVYMVYQLHLLSSLSVLAVMGGAGLAIGVWLVILLRPQLRPTTANPTPGMVLADHWQYGRWSSATVVLTWLPGNIYYTLLPIWFGLESTAALRTILNLVLPIQHTIAAISNLVVPGFSKAFREYGRMGLRRSICFTLTLFSLGSVLYWLLLILFRHQAVSWLYGGRYGEYADLLIMIGALPLSGGIVAVIGGALRAMEQPDRIFWCYVVSSSVTLTLGLWLLRTQSIIGAVLGLLTSVLSTASVMVWFYIRQSPDADRKIG